MDEPEGMITVRGEAVVSAVPDEVRFRLSVSAVRSRHAEALQDVTARSHELDSLLDELGIPKTKRSTSGISIRENREWVEERSVHRGYEALSSIVVRLDDPSIAGRLLEGAVEHAQALVDGPWWSVDGDNPARLEACAKAARDARRKAEAYAEASGLGVGPIVSIREAVETPWRGGGMVLSGVARAAGAEEIGIEPGQLDVFASVTIAFAIVRESREERTDG
jgi:uncharacterized protein